ncbi:MAG TPA: phosphopantetheine-binding protein [Oculatellaceae cyanobacterium]
MTYLRGNSTEQVLLSFQQTSLLVAQRFMDAQQSVMLFYLNSAALIPRNLGATPQSDLYSCSTMQDFSIPSRLGFGLISSRNNSVIPAAQAQISLSEPVRSETPTAVELAPTPRSISELPEPSSEHAEEFSLGSENAPLSESSLAGDQSVDHHELITAFVELVSDRTGYPVDMLDPGLDLESDLGIDSIKRVEILSKFRTMLPERVQEVLENNLEQVAGARTIHEIADWLQSSFAVNSDVTAAVLLNPEGTALSDEFASNDPQS